MQIRDHSAWEAFYLSDRNLQVGWMVDYFLSPS